MLLWDNTESVKVLISTSVNSIIWGEILYMTPCLFTLRLEPRFCQFSPKDIELCSRAASGPCSSLSAHALEFILWRFLGTARSFLRTPSCWQMSLQRAYLKWHFLLARQIPSFCLPHFSAVTSASWIINDFLPLQRCLKIMAVVLNPR